MSVVVGLNSLITQPGERHAESSSPHASRRSGWFVSVLSSDFLPLLLSSLYFIESHSVGFERRWFCFFFVFVFVLVLRFIKMVSLCWTIHIWSFGRVICVRERNLKFSVLHVKSMGYTIPLEILVRVTHLPSSSFTFCKISCFKHNSGRKQECYTFFSKFFMKHSPRFVNIILIFVNKWFWMPCPRPPGADVLDCLSF